MNFKQSKFLGLSMRDVLRSLILAVGAPVLLAVQQELSTGKLPDVKTLGMVAVSAGVTYLLKNFFTKPDTK